MIEARPQLAGGAVEGLLKMEQPQEAKQEAVNFAITPVAQDFATTWHAGEIDLVALLAM